MSVWMIKSDRQRFLTWLRGWIGFPVQGFPTQSLNHTETDVGLHVKCSLLLSNLNQNWKMSTNFIKTSWYKISWKSAQLFSGFFLWKDRQTHWHGKANRSISATFGCGRVWNGLWIRTECRQAWSDKCLNVIKSDSTRKHCRPLRYTWLIAYLVLMFVVCINFMITCFWTIRRELSFSRIYYWNLSFFRGSTVLERPWPPHMRGLLSYLVIW
jgi:hypothetical protein